MSEVQLIRDDVDYQRGLTAIRGLIESNPAVGSPLHERLDLLSVLVEKYEAERFLVEPIDPIDAISLKMVELGIQQRDLAKLLGSASRASELMNRRRSLTLEQIRILHRELRIPADVLIGNVQPKRQVSDDQLLSLPLKAMVDRGWLEPSKSKEQLAGQVRELLTRLSTAASPVFLRKSVRGSISEPDRLTIFAWLSRVILRAREKRREGQRYVPGSISMEFLQQLAKLSTAKNGPRLALEFLALKGVFLIIEPQLPGMKLDGAVLRDDDGTAVIGMTLRYDRLDSFWFTLMHEIVHLMKHVGSQQLAFVDNLDLSPDDDREIEADLLALEAFIPRTVWPRSDASRTRSRQAVMQLANQLCIHHAIVAGRVRRESGNFRILADLLGQGGVRKQLGVLT